MLVLTRRPKQQIMIGDDITINIVEVQGDNVRIAIDAPKSLKIFRGEIYKLIKEENKKANFFLTIYIFGNRILTLQRIYFMTRMQKQILK